MFLVKIGISLLVLVAWLFFRKDHTSKDQGDLGASFQHYARRNAARAEEFR